jgi:hypothetical protein
MIFERGAVLKTKHFKTINDLTEGHLLYFFENVEEYIQNVIEFVISGLEKNQYPIIIENDRIILFVKKILESMLNESQLIKVKFLNNFDFYFEMGDFRCNSIFKFLPSLIEGYAEKKYAVRSWAHVEWGDEREVHKKLSDSEREADVIVNEKGLLSVCAYNSDRVSEELKKKLLIHHNFLVNPNKQGIILLP